MGEKSSMVEASSGEGAVSAGMSPGKLTQGSTTWHLTNIDFSRIAVGSFSLGSILAWFWIVVGSGRILLIGDIGPYFELTAGSVALFAIGLFLAPRLLGGRLANKPKACAMILGALLAVFTGIAFAPQIGIPIDGLLVMISMWALGLLLAFLVCGCAAVFGDLPTSQGLISTVLSLLAMLFVYFFMDSMPPLGVYACCVLLLPAVTYVVFYGMRFSGDDAAPAEEGALGSSRDQYALPPRKPFAMYASFMAYIFSISFVRGAVAIVFNDVNVSRGSNGSIVFAGALAVLILFLYLTRKAGLPALLGGCYVYGVLGTATAVSILTLIGQAGFVVRMLSQAAFLFIVILAWCCMLALAGEGDRASSRRAGAFLGCMALAAALGWSLPFLLSLFDADSSAMTTSLVLLGTVNVVFFFFAFTEKDFKESVVGNVAQPDLRVIVVDDNLFGALSASAAGGGERESNWEDGKQTKAKRGAFVSACLEIAEEGRLSEREREVLLLLAKGYDANSIADQLVLSYNTIRSHIRKIYTKTDIHTHQELIAVIEARAKEKKRQTK